jgi:uncharacterized protein
MRLDIDPLADAAVLLDINNAALPDIGELNIHKAQWLVDHCVMPGLVTLDGQAAGIVVVLSDSCGYDSDFYRWFTDRYENFLYIDRIVVADWARGQGVAKQIYQAIDALAQAKELAIVADVYCEPPNTPSLNLHHTMGFEEVGRQHFPAKRKIAAKFMKYAERTKARQPPS